MLKRIYKALSCVGDAAVHVTEPAATQPTPEQIKPIGIPIDSQARFNALMRMPYSQPYPRVTDARDDGRAGFAVEGYMR